MLNQAMRHGDGKLRPCLQFVGSWQGGRNATGYDARARSGGCLICSVHSIFSALFRNS
jgi:hypothetical protein